MASSDGVVECKHAVLTAKERVEVQQRPVAAPGPGQVRVRVGSVGICGR